MQRNLSNVFDGRWHYQGCKRIGEVSFESPVQAINDFLNLMDIGWLGHIPESQGIFEYEAMQDGDTEALPVGALFGGDDRHSIDGFLSAQRYQLAKEQRMPGPLPYAYAAAYRIQTDDLKGVLAALGEVVATGTRTDAGDPARRAIWVLEPLGPERTA
jgi:hypothetical protein